jgi:hypothetical protein
MVTNLVRRRLVLPAAFLAACAAAAYDTPPAHAQAEPGLPVADTAGTYLDAGAAALLDRARSARQQTDRSLRSYTALVRSRLAGDLRMPLKDRNLIRYESAARMRWSRDGDDIVQLYGSRMQSPAGVQAPRGTGPGVSQPFDPGMDRLYFGMMPDSARDDGDFWIEHPLGGDAERHYRYQSGDTLTIRLQDGRVVRVVELRVIPRRNDPHSVRGVLWIDSSTGALVRGAFRLARKLDILRDTGAMDDDDVRTVSKVPLINPMEFDLSLMTVEYALWDLTHWLPRTMRLEGMARTGVLRFPFAFDVSYEMQEVVTDRDDVAYTEEEAVRRTLEEWGGDDYRVRTRRREGHRVRVMTPRDSSLLLDHELLPPPAWANADGFPTEAELRRIYDRVASVVGPSRPDLPVRFGWGYGEPGMLRYNRVEALSVGARLTAPLPYATLTATARIGAGDLHPGADLLLARETMRRTLELRGYHELATVEPSRHAFGAGNSLSALLFGRDEGEYYRTTGVALTYAPPPLRRRSWELRTYIEHQDAARRHTHVALPRLWHDSVFRPNIAAYETMNFGTLLLVRPWWGIDPLGAQFGLDMMLQAEGVEFLEAGDRAWYQLPREHVVRGRVTARTAVPLPGGLRAGAEAGIGAVRGSFAHSGFASVPPQRLFYLGGARTLRGYEPGTLWGPDMARGRLELARAFSFANLAVFTDYGRTSQGSDWTSELWSAGAGASLLDGLVRLDLAHGIGARRGWQAAAARRGWRLDLHLDAVL